MRLLLIFVLLLSGFIPAISYADSVGERRLTISTSIFPKIVALDQQLATKAALDGNLYLAVVYVEDEENAKNTALNIRNRVKKLAGITVKIENPSLSQLLNTPGKRYAGLLLAEKLSEKDLLDIIAFSSKQNILLFSPFDGDIERGASSSIFVGAKIQPYFNLSALRAANIQLRPSILTVSKTYE